MGELTDAQKLAFKRNGFLAVPDALDEDLVTDVREAIWEGIEADPADPDSLVGGGYHLNEYEAVDRPKLFERVNQDVYAYAEEMVGPDLLEPPGDRVQIALKFPDEDQLLSGTELPRHGHIDGYGPGFNADGRVHGFTIGVAVYYSDVDPRSGGFTVWPGSHWQVAEYYASHVLETPGHAHHDSLPSEVGDPHEITGRAGTAILWHNKLVHTGGVNRSRNVRLASISRFKRRDFDEIQRDAADKLWKYWPGLEGLNPADVYPEVVEFMRREYGEESEEDAADSDDSDGDYGE